MDYVSKITWGLSLVGAVALGVFGMWFFGSNSKEQPPTQVPLISLEKMGYLATVKVNYSGIIDYPEKRTQGLPWTDKKLKFGGTKVLLVARGDCTVATDLQFAEYEGVNPETHTLTLKLQTPKSIVARLNLSSRQSGGSYLYDITNQGLEMIIPGPSNRTEAINHALTFAQSEIERACNQADIIATAKKNAEDVLSLTFQAVGWKVKFSWR